VLLIEAARSLGFGARVVTHNLHNTSADGCSTAAIGAGTTTYGPTSMFQAPAGSPTPTNRTIGGGGVLRVAVTERFRHDQGSSPTRDRPARPGPTSTGASAEVLMVDGASVRGQKKLVKLNAHRNVTNSVSTTMPNARSPYGPTKILETADRVMAHGPHDVFKTISERRRLAHVARSTMEIGADERALRDL
jgi:hypothetical protein